MKKVPQTTAVTKSARDKTVENRSNAHFLSSSLFLCDSDEELKRGGGRDEVVRRLTRDKKTRNKNKDHNTHNKSTVGTPKRKTAEVFFFPHTLCRALFCFCLILCLVLCLFSQNCGVLLCEVYKCATVCYGCMGVLNKTTSCQKVSA